MDLKINATVHISPLDAEGIIRDFIKQKTGKEVGKVTFKVRESSDDRYQYTPAGLSGIDVELKV